MAIVFADAIVESDNSTSPVGYEVLSSAAAVGEVHTPTVARVLLVTVTAMGVLHVGVVCAYLPRLGCSLPTTTQTEGEHPMSNVSRAEGHTYDWTPYLV